MNVCLRRMDCLQICEDTLSLRVSRAVNVCIGRIGAKHCEDLIDANPAYRNRVRKRFAEMIKMLRQQEFDPARASFW